MRLREDTIRLWTNLREDAIWCWRLRRTNRTLQRLYRDRNFLIGEMVSHNDSLEIIDKAIAEQTKVLQLLIHRK